MKSDQLLTFNNKEIGEIRGFIKDGELWFLAGQVCRTLGIKDTGNAIKQVTERLKIAEYSGSFSKRVMHEDAIGRKQLTYIIPEHYLYELIFGSRKKKAIKFRTWVTSEVLPSLRAHGEYRMSGKLITNNLHDGIQDKLVPYIESPNGKKFIYSNFHKLINKSLGLPPKNNKDELSDEMLEKIAYRENLVNALINEGKEYNNIKDILNTLNL